MAGPTRMQRLEELVRAHQARLRSYVYSRTGSVEAADDIVQEAFLVAYERMDQYDRARPALPWLMGMARNELREHWRSAARESSSERLEALAAERQLSRDESPGAHAILSEQLLAVRSCVEKLPEKSRELVELLYTQRLNCKQVAERWRKGAGAIRVAIHRVRRALRGCIETSLSGDPA